MKNADRRPRTGTLRPLARESARTASAPHATSSDDTALKSDPAFPIIAEILAVVPASRWAFARVLPNGGLAAVFGSHAHGSASDTLADEFERQRARATSGPRIAASLGHLEGFASGVTLVFADSRTDFGILTLLRTSDLGPFRSSEIRLLTFGLDAGSDRLAELRLQPLSCEPVADPTLNKTARRSSASSEAYYVLDLDFRIVLGWDTNRFGTKTPAATGENEERLPDLLERALRDLTAGWEHRGVNDWGVGHPLSFLVIRAHPLSGTLGHHIGVHIDRFHAPNSLTGPASRFHISPREIQVLAELLEGSHLEQIATQLHITSSTVQDHIKSMLDKTESVNRSELIARVLGWNSKLNASERR